MKTIFISYSEFDSEIVTRLKEDLYKYDSTWYFKESFRKESNLSEHLNEALDESDHVLCILTKNYEKQYPEFDETYPLVDREGKLIFLIFDQRVIKKKQSANLVPCDVDFHVNYDKGLNELIDIIKDPQSTVEVYAKIQHPSKVNPFGAVRAEFIQKSLIANIFYTPEKDKYDLLTGPSAVILEGGRGSGKTIILRSLEVMPAIAISKTKTFKESGLKFFGIYLRIDRGGMVLSSESEIETLGTSTAKTLFLDDMNLQFAEVLVDVLSECIESKILEIDKNLEEELSDVFVTILKADVNYHPTRFSDLQKWINDQKRIIREYIAKKSMGLDRTYEGCFTSLDTFRRICVAITSKIRDLQNVTIFLLLDEYENFLTSQQQIVNTLIKMADNVLTFKIATKFEGVSTYQTLLGQELQRAHDFAKIRLDYDLANNITLDRYKTLLKGISSKLLQYYGFKETDIQKLLKSGEEQYVTKSDLIEPLKKMLSEKDQDIENLSEKQINEKISYYKTALTFRVLSKKRKRNGKNYSGFETYVYLSSGIIRCFLELCGMAYYIADQEGTNVFQMHEIPSPVQTQAAYYVSHALLEKLALGVEDYGITMQNFVMDIGDIFRTKLLYDNNEPETIRIGVEEPMNLWSPRLRQLIQSGFRESVFQKIDDSQIMKPKNMSPHRSSEFLLNRIFAPGLGISYTARWRTSFKASDLDQLIRDDKHSKIKLQFVSKIKKNLWKESHTTIDEWQ